MWRFEFLYLEMNLRIFLFRDQPPHFSETFLHDLKIPANICLDIYFFKAMIVFVGSNQAVLLPGYRVYKQCSDLQQHSAGQCRPSDHAHPEAVLLGGQPSGPQRGGS